MLVHGEAERFVEAKRSALIDRGDNVPFLQVVRRGDAGEVDGLARRVFKVEHDGHPLGFRGDCRGRRGAHRGDEAHEQQEGKNHVEKGAASLEGRARGDGIE